MAPNPWRETPLTESAALSRAAGCRIFLKHDELQPSGCFKSRGVGNYMKRRLEEKLRDGVEKVHFYCSSGGNAGLGAVYAAKSLGQLCTVVVPTSTKPMMIEKVKAAGASDVIQIGAHWSEADAYLRMKLLKDDPIGVYVPPFDHPYVFEGNSTVIREIQHQLPSDIPTPTAVVCSAGGGGLFCGIFQGLQEVGWSNTQVLVMQTHGANALHKSVEAGQMVTIPAITSKATSLGATTPAAKAFEYAQDPRVRITSLTDAEAAMGCLRLADDERILVELACGVNVALCYEGRLSKALGRRVEPEEVVVIEVCGGSNISLAMLNEMREEHGLHHLDTSQARSGVPSDLSVGQLSIKAS